MRTIKIPSFPRTGLYQLYVMVQQTRSLNHRIRTVFLRKYRTCPSRLDGGTAFQDPQNSPVAAEDRHLICVLELVVQHHLRPCNGETSRPSRTYLKPMIFVALGNDYVAPDQNYGPQLCCANRLSVCRLRNCSTAIEKQRHHLRFRSSLRERN